jgi:hypothetical protein
VHSENGDLLIAALTAHRHVSEPDSGMLRVVGTRSMLQRVQLIGMAAALGGVALVSTA